MGGSISVTSKLGEGSTFRVRLMMEVCDDSTIRRGLGTSGSYSDSPDLSAVSMNDTTASANNTPTAAATTGTSWSMNAIEKESEPMARARREHKILIADDLELNCKLLSRMVTSMGYTSQIAHDGLEAIDAIKADMAEVRAKMLSEGIVDPPPSSSFLCVFLDLNMVNLDGWGTLAKIRGELGLTQLPVIAITAESLQPKRAQEAGFTLSLGKPFRKPALLAVLEPLLRNRVKMEEASTSNSTPTPMNNLSSSGSSKSESHESETPSQDAFSPSSGSNTPESPVNALKAPRNNAMLSHHGLMSPTRGGGGGSTPPNLHHLVYPPPRPPTSSSAASQIPELQAHALQHLHDAAQRSISPPSTTDESSTNTTNSPSSTTPSPSVSGNSSNDMPHLSHSTTSSGTSLTTDPSMIPLMIHRRAHSDNPSSTAQSPPVRPSSHQRVAISAATSGAHPTSSCTPSSHRHSWNDSARSDDGSDMSHSVSPLQIPRAVHSSSSTRVRGTHSPLSLSGSPRIISRHLIIEPTNHLLSKRATSAQAHRPGRNGNGSGNGGNGLPSTNALSKSIHMPPHSNMSSLISDSIVSTGGTGSSGGSGSGSGSGGSSGSSGNSSNTLTSDGYSSGSGRRAHATRSLRDNHSPFLDTPASIPPLHPNLTLMPSPHMALDERSPVSRQQQPPKSDLSSTKTTDDKSSSVDSTSTATDSNCTPVHSSHMRSDDSASRPSSFGLSDESVSSSSPSSQSRSIGMTPARSASVPVTSNTLKPPNTNTRKRPSSGSSTYGSSSHSRKNRDSNDSASHAMDGLGQHQHHVARSFTSSSPNRSSTGSDSLSSLSQASGSETDDGHRSAHRRSTHHRRRRAGRSSIPSQSNQRRSVAPTPIPAHQLSTANATDIDPIDLQQSQADVVPPPSASPSAVVVERHTPPLAVHSTVPSSVSHPYPPLNCLPDAPPAYPRPWPTQLFDGEYKERKKKKSHFSHQHADRQHASSH